VIKSRTNEASSSDGPLEILEDWRWGFRVLYMGRAGELLLINSAANTCAAFIGRKVNGQVTPVGTCFFVNLMEHGFYSLYLVTARHLIDNTRRKDLSDDQIVYLHFNDKGGGLHQVITSIPDNWIGHPTDENIDVAILPFRALGSLDHSAVPCEPYDIPDPQKWRIQIGTDVFITGLFLRHYGKQRQIPIIRTGTIAAMPEEPVDMSDVPGERQIQAYLIETHSMGGLSGSPVFANPMDVSLETDRAKLQTMHIWIGVVSGHWQFDEDRSEPERINSGIAIVSPRESVLEVLQQPRLIEMREKEMKRRTKGHAPTMDDAGERVTQKTRAPKKGDRIDIPIPTREQFEHDLAKVIRKRDKK
jgi:hypothetical protein